MRRLTGSRHHNDMVRMIHQIVNLMGKRDQAIHQVSDFAKAAAEGVHIIHTTLAATSLLLRAAESFVGGPNTTIHIHAPLPIPYHLELDNPLISSGVVERAIGACVSNFGSPERTYAVRVYGCRDRVDSLLHRLPSASLVLVAAGWRPWPTYEQRLIRTLKRAGHHVLSIHVCSSYLRNFLLTSTEPQELSDACACTSPNHMR